MTEATAICQLAASLLSRYEDHPQYHRILLPGIQGVEAVLTILQECYGYSYPGGLFLAAVDVMLEKQAVVQTVKQQLQHCTGSNLGPAAEQQQQQQAQQQLTASSTSSLHPSSAGGSAACSSTSVSAASSQHSSPTHQEQLQQHQPPWQAAQPGAGGIAGQRVAHTTPAQGTSAPIVQYWAADLGAAAAPAEAHVRNDRGNTSSTVSAAVSASPTSTSRSSRQAVPADNRASGVAVSPQPTSFKASSPAQGTPSKPRASPASPAAPSTATRLRQQASEQQELQRQHQHQQLQALLFDAPSEVFTASLAGSLRHIDLSAVNSPQQIQAQQELQQELSRSSWSSARHTAREQWQLHTEQQQMLPRPQKAQEQRQLQETLQFARQPVPVAQQQLPGSPVSTWQQWQQQQQQSEGSGRHGHWWQQQQHTPSPLARPQPQHKQPPLTPPLAQPHASAPAATPLSAALQQQARAQPQDNPAATVHQGQGPLGQQQQQRQDQLQDLQHLVGILQPVLYDDAAASEVLSEWLSGSDIAVADSDVGSEGPLGRTHTWQAAHMMVPPGSQAAATVTPAHALPVVPQVLSFTPAAAGAMPASREQQPQHGGFTTAPGAVQQGRTSGAAALTGQPNSQPLWPHNPTAAQMHHTGGYNSSGGGGMPVLQPSAAAASPGSSSITVRQPVAGDLEEMQSLVLDIDLAKVLDSSGTIVLHVGRDESGALTAAAALAPVPYGGTTSAVGTPLAASPVARVRGLQQDLPSGSISVDGSIRAAASSSRQQRPGTSRLQQQQEIDSRPVHRVLRYSAEGSLYSTADGAQLLSEQGPSAASQPGSWVEGDDGADLQQHQEEEECLLQHLARPRHLGDASWVLADIQPTSQLFSSPQREHAWPQQAASSSRSLNSPHSTQEQSSGVDAAAGLDGCIAATAVGRDAEQGGQSPSEHQAGGGSAAQVQVAVDEVHGNQEALVSQQHVGPQEQQQRKSLELLNHGRATASGGQDAPAADGTAAAAAAATQSVRSAQDPSLPGLPEPAAEDSQYSSLSGTSAGAVTPTPAAHLPQAAAATEYNRQAGSPMPPELVPTDTPAGFRFWGGGRAGRAAATAAAGAGLRYNPGQQTLESLSNIGALQNSGGVDAEPVNAVAAACALTVNAHHGTDAAGNAAPAAMASAAPRAGQGLQPQQQHPGHGTETGCQAAAGENQHHQQQQQQQLADDLSGQSLELLGLSEARLSQLGLDQVSLDLLAGLQANSLEAHMLQAWRDAAAGSTAGLLHQHQDGAQQQLVSAQQLAASAMALVRQSLALAAAGVQQQSRRDVTTQQQQQQPDCPSGPGSIRAFESLEFLPQVLLQSLQAAAPSMVSPEDPGQLLSWSSSVLPLLLLSQQQVLQPRPARATDTRGGQQQVAAHGLTDWLSNRFGAGSQLQDSVSVLLQELEQQQQQQQVPLTQQASSTAPDSSVRNSPGVLAAPTAAPVPADGEHQAPHQDLARLQQHDTAATAQGGVDRNAAADSPLCSPVDPGTVHSPPAVLVPGALADAAQHTPGAPVPPSPAAHDGDASELCATASPIMTWQAARWGLAVKQLEHEPDHPQQQQQQQEQQDATSPALQVAPVQHQHQQQQQSPEHEGVQEEEGSESWSSSVQQLLQVSGSPVALGDVAAMPTSDSLAITPSTSCWVYSQSDNTTAKQDAAAAAGGAGGGAAEVRQEPSLFRTSVMTNPLYWAEPSAVDVGLGGGQAYDAAAAAAATSTITQQSSERKPQCAADVLQQYLPYSSSSSSCGSRRSSSSSDSCGSKDLVAAGGLLGGSRQQQQAAVVCGRHEDSPPAHSQVGVFQHMSPAAAAPVSAADGAQLPTHQGASAAGSQEQHQLEVVQQHEQQQLHAVLQGSTADSSLGAALAGAAAVAPAASSAGAAVDGQASIDCDDNDGAAAGDNSECLATIALSAAVSAATAAMATQASSHVNEWSCGVADTAVSAAAAVEATEPSAEAGSDQQTHPQDVSPTTSAAATPDTARMQDGSAGAAAAVHCTEERLVPAEGCSTDTSLGSGVEHSTLMHTSLQDDVDEAGRHTQPHWRELPPQLGWESDEQQGPAAEGSGPAVLQPQGLSNTVVDSGSHQASQQGSPVAPEVPQTCLQQLQPHSQGDQEHDQAGSASIQPQQGLHQAGSPPLSPPPQQPKQQQVPSRIQRLMQKLRNRRRLHQGPEGPAHADQQAAATAAESDVAPPQVHGIADSSNQPDPAEVDSTAATQQHEAELSPCGSNSLPAVSVPGEMLQTDDASSSGAPSVNASPATSQASCSDTGAKAAAVASSVAAEVPDVRSLLDSAVEDTLRAAEEAMQQALQRMQLLKDQDYLEQQQQQEGEQHQLLQVQQPHSLQQQQQQQQQESPVHVQQATGHAQQPLHVLPGGLQAEQVAQPGAADSSCWDQLQQQHYHPGSVGQQAGQQQEHQQTHGRGLQGAVSSPCPEGAGGPHGSQMPQLQPPDNASVQWVREVLQGSSGFSRYVRSVVLKPAGHQACMGDKAISPALEADPATASASPGAAAGGPDNSNTTEGRRLQVANKMSALLAAVSADVLQHSNRDDTDIIDTNSDIDGDSSSSAACGNGCETTLAVPGGSKQDVVRRSEPVAAAASRSPKEPHGVWQDRIHVLLAAADAAALTLSQPPQPPTTQQQQQQQEPRNGTQRRQRTVAAPAAAPRPERVQAGCRMAHSSKAAAVQPVTVLQGASSQAYSCQQGSKLPAAAAATVRLRQQKPLAGAGIADEPVPCGNQLHCAAGWAATAAQQDSQPVPEPVVHQVTLQQPHRLAQAAGATAGSVSPTQAPAAATGRPGNCAAAAHGPFVSSQTRVQPCTSVFTLFPSVSTKAIPCQQQEQQDPAAEDKLQQRGTAQAVAAPQAFAAAALPVRQRQRLQQLSQQRMLQKQTEHRQQHVLPGGSRPQPKNGEGPTAVAADTASAAASTAVASDAISSTRQQPQKDGPEGGAVMLVGQLTSAAVKHASKAGQQQNKQPASDAGAAAGVSTGSASSQPAVQQIHAVAAKGSMFDVPRPSTGYTFNKAKAKAVSNLAGPADCTAGAAPLQKNAAGEASKQGSKPASRNAAATGTAAASMGEVQQSTRRQQAVQHRSLPGSQVGPCATIAAQDNHTRRPAAAAKQQALFAVSPEASTQDLQTETQHEAATAVPERLSHVGSGRLGCRVVAGRPVQLECKQGGVAGRLPLQQACSGDLQAQQSCSSSSRSHGLSLRRGAASKKQQLSSSLPAVTTAPAPDRPHQEQQHRAHSQTVGPDAAQHTSERHLRLRQRSNVQAVCAGAVRAVVGAGADVARQPTMKAGSTSGGTVAAVAAIKAALAGFGTRSWQQQDITTWLCKLRLDLLSEEHTQPLLNNPLRNGLLLAGIAAAVTLQPLNAIQQPVHSLVAARSNLLTAASHMGLISSSFATKAVAAAAKRDKDEAHSSQGSGAAVLGAQGSGPSGSPGFRAGASGVLQGSPITGRSRGAGTVGVSTTGSPLRRHHSTRNLSPSRSYFSVAASSSFSGGGCGGMVLDVSSSCECFVVVAAGPRVNSLADGAGPPATLSSSLCGPASSCRCDCWACVVLDGTVLEHAVLQLLELVIAGDVSCMWGLLYALQQAFPVVPQVSSSKQRTPAGPDSSSSTKSGKTPGAGTPVLGQKQRQRQQATSEACSGSKSHQGSGGSRREPASQVRAAGSGASGCAGGCVVVQPLQGPSWRSFQLPYSAAELQELEHHLLCWLGDLDLIDPADSPDFSCISTELATGVLLAEVAAAVGAAPVVGVQERPVTAAARLSNIQAALDAVQSLPGLRCKCLLQDHAAAVLAGERPALTALLEALWVWDTGAQGPWLRWAKQQGAAEASKALRRSSSAADHPATGTTYSSTAAAASTAARRQAS